MLPPVENPIISVSGADPTEQGLKPVVPRQPFRPAHVSQGLIQQNKD